MANNQEFIFEKKWLLLLVAGVCVYLYFYGANNIPYHQYLGNIAGGFHTANFLINFAK